MLYDLITDPDVEHTPGDEYLTSVEVTSLQVQNGHSYLFWYRTVVVGGAEVSEDMDSLGEAQYQDYN